MKAVITVAALVLSAPAFAQSVDIKNPWVRVAVPGQKATGAFMRLTAERDLRHQQHHRQQRTAAQRGRQVAQGLRGFLGVEVGLEGHTNHPK